jgi:hypothetical protein
VSDEETCVDEQCTKHNVSPYSEHSSLRNYTTLHNLHSEPTAQTPSNEVECSCGDCSGSCVGCKCSNRQGDLPLSVNSQNKKGNEPSDENVGCRCNGLDVCDTCLGAVGGDNCSDVPNCDGGCCQKNSTEPETLDLDTITGLFERLVTTIEAMEIHMRGK